MEGGARGGGVGGGDEGFFAGSDWIGLEGL